MPRWVDLSRFGASLKILPATPLRGGAATVLEVSDRLSFASHRHLPDNLPLERVHEERARLREDLAHLGFAEEPRSGNYQESTNTTSLIWYGSRTQFALADLQRLYPDVAAGDFKDMPLEAIVGARRPDPAFAKAWAAFTDEALPGDAKAVWTPRVNPYDKPLAESPDICRADPLRTGNLAPTQSILRNIPLSPDYVVHHLSRAHYRTNVLVPYYADEAAALADGWTAKQLEVCDFPHALPLWITGKGKIIAVRDVRYATELMFETPRSMIGRSPAPVQALRFFPGLTASLESAWQSIVGWAKDPASLPDVEALPKVLQQLATTLRDAEVRIYGERIRRLNAPFWDEPSGLIAPLGHWTPHKIDNAAGVLAAYGVAGGDSRTLLAQLTAAFDATKTLGHAQALTAAQTQLRTMAGRVQREDAAEERASHVDAGEKIGGARKDFARQALRHEDLDAMNDQERTALVVKKNVWPPLDYAAMRDAGVTSHAAMAIKVLKDALNTQPDRRRGDPDAESHYIRSIAHVRDVMADVTTLEDFGKALTGLYEYGITIPGTDHKHENGITGCTSTQVQWGSKVSELIWRGNNGYLPHAITGPIRRKLGEDANEWGPLIPAKKIRTEDETDATKKKDAIDRELHRPHLDHVERIGAAWRKGRDIGADDLIQHFGFRAVEFGNWLPQDERQQVLNMAFDSFCDLADALDLPPAAVSLGGELAIAFGSRGRGGRHAALAHYESARRVINLTRMNGAGALAHEWCHGLDFQWGEGKFASETFKENTTMGSLAQAMQRRPAAADQLRDTAQANAERGRDNATSWLYLQPAESRGLLKDINDAAFGRVQEQFLAAAMRAFEREPVFCQSAYGALHVTDVTDAQEDICDRLKKACPSKPGFTKVRAKIESNLAFALRNLAVMCTIQAAEQAGKPVPATLLCGHNAELTDFLKEAKKLDAMRSSPYWATTRELFARAGAAYVGDRLTVKGVRSDYLVYGSDEVRYADHPVGNPNPTGEDRRALAECFDALIADVRLRFTAEDTPQLAQA
ncbi:MAG: LPD1 domain-containing protein [Rhodanobacter sp.]